MMTALEDLLKRGHVREVSLAMTQIGEALKIEVFLKDFADGKVRDKI